MTVEVVCQPNDQLNMKDESDTGSCVTYEIKESPLSEKVDLCVTVIGGEKPPSLPIRQELRSNGVECVYEAKGVGQEVVSKERSIREALIAKRLEALEKKLQNNSSPRKKKKNLKKLQELQKKLEQKMKNSSSGITYASYALHMVELMKSRCLIDSEEGGVIENDDKVGNERTGDDCTETGESLVSSVDSVSISSDMAKSTVGGSLEIDGEHTEDSNTTTSLSTTERNTKKTNNDHEKEPFLDRELEKDKKKDIRNPEEHRSRVGRPRRRRRRLATNPDAGLFPLSVSSKITKTGDKSDIPKNDTSQRYGDTDTDISNDFLFDERSEVGGVLESVCEDSVLESLAGESVMSSKSAGSGRFKGIKASTEETINRARALLEQAKASSNTINVKKDDVGIDSVKPIGKIIDNDSVESIKKISAVSSTKVVIKVANNVTPDEPNDTPDDQPALLSKNSEEDNISPKPPPMFVQESGRYHLFVSHACPWSHRTSVVRAIKGVEHVVSMSYVNCTWDPLSLWDAGFECKSENDASFWSISDSTHDKMTDDLDSDELIFHTFKEVVLEKFDGPIQVPILWDKCEKCIISNSSVEIMWILNFEFNKWAKRPKINLFPPGSKANNDDVNQWLHDAINVGIYRCGVATSQENYDKAVDELTEALDKAETIVKKGGFLAGEYLTESDIRLFVTLIRFDEVYRVLFKTNTRRISKMSGLLTYARDIYRVKRVRQTCNMAAIKKAYYGARTQVIIVPRGESFLELLDKDDH